MDARSLVRLATAAALTSSLAVAAPAGAGVTLVPHKARYALSLHPSSGGGDVAAVRGLLEVTFEESCDGWRVEQYLGFRMMTQEGTGLEHLARLAGFEDRDGRGFTFSTTTWEDRRLVEELSGVARRGASGDGAVVRYSRPQARVEELPPETIFPARHVELILDAAAAGKRNARHTVFDGSTDDNPYEISTWIGRSRAATAGAPEAIAGRRSWPVRLAYYPVGAVDPQPQFEMSVSLYEGGIAGDMIYDYGDFAIDVRVEAVEVLPAPECR